MAATVMMLITLLITGLIAILVTIPANAVHPVGNGIQSLATDGFSSRKFYFKGDGGRRPKWIKRRRRLIGSTAPNCTYNECRGCKYRCRAEQIPVDGNDPINSAYRYKCVCHR